jgi:hypothetical protein
MMRLDHLVPAHEAQYYQQFGHFIHRFAQTEKMTHALFHFVSGTGEAVARTISGGMALGHLISLTKRVIAARNLDGDMAAETDLLFQQLSDIAKLRDYLVHRGASFDEENLLVLTNQMTARSLDNVEVLILQIDDIENALKDLVRIGLRMAWLITPHDAPQWEGMNMEAFRAVPWSYKHRQPTLQNPPPHTSAQ